MLMYNDVVISGKLLRLLTAKANVVVLAYNGPSERMTNFIFSKVFPLENLPNIGKMPLIFINVWVNCRIFIFIDFLLATDDFQSEDALLYPQTCSGFLIAEKCLIMGLTFSEETQNIFPLKC